MFKLMRKRLVKDEGFTLIELMVVVLIIAVLVAIAIPSFLGFRDRAQDRSAQSDVRNALLAEKGYWTDNAGYTATDTELQSFMPSLELTDTAAGSITDAGVWVEVHTQAPATSPNYACVSQYSQSGKVFMVWQPSDGVTQYGVYANTTDWAAATCNQNNPAGGTWKSAGW